MHLPDAIGLKRGEVLAFVGAGGKTSAMFALAEALAPPVALTTTTHLGAWQAGLADNHFILRTPEVLKDIDFKSNATLLFTGPAGDDDRLKGLSGEILDALYRRCRELALPLLIEADGARQRSLKAPTDYEPVIPGWVDIVVVLAGLAGLGKPLGDAFVHRPAVFSDLTGCALGSAIKPEHLKTLLTSKKGGVKTIPDGARKVLFLNQAEGEALQGIAHRLAQELMDVYDRILVGSLHAPDQAGPVFSVHARTAGVILAAGGSERLGRPKQLLDWGGVPFIRQVALNALEASLAPLVAVTGADRDQIESALAGLDVRCVHNPQWAEGQSTSMRAGLAALPENTDSALFLLSDQPQIDPGLIRQLLAHYAEHRGPITAPMVRGQRANPVLFGQEAFNALREVKGDRGGRAVFGQFQVDWLPWADDRILLDVDQEGDYERLLEAFSRE